MPAPLIESSSQYRALCRRIAALETHLRAIDAIAARANAQAGAGEIELEDADDFRPLGDARSDIVHTLRGLAEAAGEWEDRRFRNRLDHPIP